MLVVPRFAPAQYADRGAVGLFVPSNGTRTSRRGALAALLRGKVDNTTAGGVPGGPPTIRLGTRPSGVTIYVSLPPPGSHPNDRRYPIAVVGGGYRGLLTSGSTRIPGLVSLADVAPSAVALERGRRPVIRSRPDADAAADLARLDTRIGRAARTRLATDLILAIAVVGGSLLALAFRSRYLGRAALLVAPAVLVGSLVLSAADVTEPWLVTLLLALLAAAAALAAGASQRLLLPAMVAVLAAYLLVLAAWPTVNSLASVGPHVEDGGRFYGLTNLPETILLTVAMVAGALAGPRGLAPLAALALVMAGWSRAGADGGGVVVFAVAFAVLALRLTGRVTPRRLVLAALGAAALALAFVGVDAASGGSSHVTHAFEKGPGAWAGDIGHRLHLSAARFVSSWHYALVVCAGLVALALLARRPRFPAGDALLAGLAVSLLVNDSPSDITAAGAICYGVLWTWERVDSHADAPPGLDRRSRVRAAHPRRLRRREDRLAAAEYRAGSAAEGAER